MKRTVLLAILLTYMIVFSGAAQVTNQNLFDTIPFIYEHHKKRLELFKTQPMKTGQVIFVGNSITEGGPWEKLFPEHDILNRGIGGDITFGLLKRLDDIIARKPTKVFILIGINDIGKDIPDAVIADNIRKIIRRLQAGTPDTKIFLQSILPVNSSVKKFPQHYDKLSHVVNTNRLLAKVAEEMSVKYLDLYSLFLDEQQMLDKQFTTDGLHLNSEGYNVWAIFLRSNNLL